METVEKWVKPLIRLLFGAWINCGRTPQNIHTPVECEAFPYIFALPRRDSCLPRLHTLHIFCLFAPKSAGDGFVFLRRVLEYPQTHSLWISIPVEREISAISAFLGRSQNVMHGLSTCIHYHLKYDSQMHNPAYAQNKALNSNQPAKNATSNRLPLEEKLSALALTDEVKSSNIALPQQCASEFPSGGNWIREQIENL